MEYSETISIHLNPASVKMLGEKENALWYVGSEGF